MTSSIIEREQLARRQQKSTIRRLQSLGRYETVVERMTHCLSNFCQALRCPARCHLAHLRQSRTVTANCLSLCSRASLLFMVTIISNETFQPGELGKWEEAVFKDKLRECYGDLLSACPNAVVIGFLDIGFYPQIGGEQFWSPHAHLLVVGAQSKDIRIAFSRMSAEAHCDRPLVVERCYDLQGLLEYCTKDLQLEYRPYLTNNGTINRRRIPLSRPQQLEMDRWLSSRPIDYGLVVAGISRANLLSDH